MTSRSSITSTSTGSADALVACQVAAVVNAAPSISGRYPNLGPEILGAAGIPLLVTTPDTPGFLVSAIKPVLVPAGATMTGQLMLRPELADPARTNALQDLVVSVAPAGIALPGGAAVAQAAVELAAALLGPPGAPGLSAAAAEKVLGGALALASLT